MEGGNIRGMKTPLAIFAVLLALGGCSYFERRPDTPARSEQPGKVGAPQIDQTCFNDCLGGDTDRELCESRCRY